MYIGWILYNACGSGMDSLRLWLAFSQKCPDKFDEQSCINAWEKMQIGSLGIGTLCMYASEDDPDAYSALIFERRRRNIFASLSGSHYDLAMLLYDEYKDYFRCASASSKRWYIFDNHIWNSTEDGMELRQKISTELVSRFNEALREVERQAGVWDPETVNSRRAQILKIIVKLKTSTFKESIMKECTEIFYDKDFEKKLDADPMIIAFNNGIYSLHTSHFRPGRPEDYISKKMPIDYEDMDENDPRVHEVRDFLEKVFPDRSIRLYWLDTTCIVFRGGNNEKKVYVWTGNGDNAKSITEQIIEKMLGTYSVKLPTSLITGKRAQSSGACPELARTGNGVRWAVLQEPDRRDEINVGIVKELSGNDSYYARDLFEKGKDMREINPMFKLALICNEPPSITRGDKALWERIRVIPFESQFVNDDELPETWEEQLREKKFAKDPQFHKKIPYLLKAFAWVLLEHYKKIRGKIGTEPVKVKLATDRYRSKNDIIHQWSCEHIEEDRDSTVGISEIYASFKYWYKEGSGLPMNSLPSRNEVVERLVKEWGDHGPNMTWAGFRFIQLEENNQDVFL
jgi:P4 family phage/plasmid primase-like protien